jgi:hypothetical protein
VTGFEPDSENAASILTLCTCGNCQQYSAASALHSEGIGKQLPALNDSDLVKVIDAWEALPDPARKAILALIQSQVD